MPPIDTQSPAETAQRLAHWRGVMREYRPWMPVTGKTPIVTLNEGATPLVESPRLAERVGAGARVWLKLEGANPTGSFKDRGMTVAVSKAVEAGARAVICASTGNTSASAAAYARRAGLACAVILPEGAIAKGKLGQAMMHGARALAVRGNFDDAMRLAREVCERRDFELVNSLNPHRIDGQKSAAFEICDQLGRAPTHQCIPVGNAGNITAYWKGYREYLMSGRIDSRPKMLGFQAAGAAPIVLGRPVENPQTFATAIRIGRPVSWKAAERARDESRGLIDSVPDDEIAAAHRWLAREEGVFCEPASAASVAGLLKLAAAGYFAEEAERGERLDVVCILTGHGLKDSDAASAGAEAPIAIDATIEAAMRALDDGA
jgi:threonine synthase